MLATLDSSPLSCLTVTRLGQRGYSHRVTRAAAALRFAPVRSCGFIPL